MDMHLDFDNEPASTTHAESERAKSPQRLRYEAEISVFKKRFGGLEETRKKLGLSRRKMCQLLLVDPSAWTRWTKDEAKVPPHVFRALEWYLLLEEKYPEVARFMAYQAVRDQGRGPDAGSENEGAGQEPLRLRVERLEQRLSKEWLKLGMAFVSGLISALLIALLKM